MLAKLAVRNIRRQIGNYLIYFITVSLTIALLFAFNNVICSSQLQERTLTSDDLRDALILVTFFVILVVSLTLGYATSFMLKLRKREFGIYLIQGMTQKNILLLFLTEMLILFLMALSTGILIGIFLYQGIMALFLKMLDLDLIFADYSLQGFFLTVITVAGIFILSSAASALYLKRATIRKLLQSENQPQKPEKHPWFWFSAAILSLAGIIESCIAFYQEIKRSILSQSDENTMLLWLAILAVSVVVFHTALSRSLIPLLLRDKRFCAVNTRFFILRQLSEQLRANALISGTIALLIAFSIIGSSTAICSKIGEELSVKAHYPFDMNLAVSPEKPQGIPWDKAQEIIRRYNEIEKEIPYTVYTDQKAYLHSFTFLAEMYTEYTDAFITESEFNQICREIGKEPVACNGRFLIISRIPAILECDFSAAALTFGDKTYPFGGIRTEEFALFSDTFFAVVPDEAAGFLERKYDCRGICLRDEKFDAKSLHEALSYESSVFLENGDEIAVNFCDYSIREYSMQISMEMSAILILSFLYIGTVFLFMAIALLSLKTFSGLNGDRKKYQILFRLGVGEAEQKKTFFKQIFIFFFLPFLLPISLSVPTGICFSEILNLNHMGAAVPTVIAYLVGTVAVIALIYILYFTATYLTARRIVIQPEA